MCSGADSIDDLDVLRTGRMPICSVGSTRPPRWARRYASSASGTPASWSRCYASTSSRWPGAPSCRPASRHRRSSTSTRCCAHRVGPGLRPCQTGASYGHTKIAGKQVLRKGLSPLATTISTPACAPVIAEMRLRAGKTGSGKGARRMLAQAIATARAAGATGNILVRGDSAYGSRTVVRACLRGKVQFSLVMVKNKAIQRAIDSIGSPRGLRCATRTPSTTPTPGHGSLTPKSPRSLTPRPPPRRTGSPPGWWYAGSKTPATPTRCSRSGAATRSSPTPSCRPPRPTSSTAATPPSKPCFADLIDGPLAHMPSGRFGANSAWVPCAAIAHNLLRAAATLAAKTYAVARGTPCDDGSSPSRRGWPDPPARRSYTSGPGRRPGYSCGPRPSTPDLQPPPDPTPPTTRPDHPDQWKRCTDQQHQHALTTNQHDQEKSRSLALLLRGFRLREPVGVLNRCVVALVL
jgi:Transposase DDE domain group 1